MARWTLSESGTVVYRKPRIPALYQVVWVDRDGRVTEIDPEWTFGGHSRWSSLALSPDGDRVAISDAAGLDVGIDLWIKPIDGGAAERFTFNGQGNNRPAWSPDGEHLIFQRDRSQGEWELAQKRADGTGETRTLVEGGSAATYSQDGRWIVYWVQPASGDIFALRVGVDSAGRPLLTERYHEFNPRLSPNGRWLAYTSDETDRLEVYVRSFPNVESMKKQVSTEGGTEVVWSRSGRELFYRNEAGELIAVDVIDEPGFSAGTQTRLFSATGFLASATNPMYDVTADGQAFVMIKEAVAGQPTKLMLAQNLLGG